MTADGKTGQTSRLSRFKDGTNNIGLKKNRFKSMAMLKKSNSTLFERNNSVSNFMSETKNKNRITNDQLPQIVK